MVSFDDFFNYNIALAKATSIEAAVYINILEKIYKKATYKDKFVKIKNKQYFSVDRKYIYKETGLPEKRQKELDIDLMGNDNLIFKPEDDKKGDFIAIDEEKITNYILADSANAITKAKKYFNDISSIQVKAKKESHRAYYINTLKSKINTGDEKLNEAFGYWIDTLIFMQKKLTIAQVEVAQQTIFKFAGNDTELAIKLVRDSADQGWRDMQWMIDKYTKGKSTTKSSSLIDDSDVEY